MDPAVRTVDENTNRLVGRRLRQARTLKGLTLAQVASKLGVSYQQAQKYEAGENGVTLGKLIVLADILEVHCLYFLNEQTQDIQEDVSPNRQIVELMRGVLRIQRGNPAAFEALCKMIAAVAPAED